jgi:formate hydrogenlyase subunit 6/NADH:ubiquinone oxidoreductase subunit I
MILAWLNDVVEGVQSCFTGMRTTGRFLLENLSGHGGATAVTREYPEQPAEVVGNRQRGHLVNDGPRCIVCHACDTVCPVDCFKMDGERDADNKKRASRIDIDLSKCIYCGLCVRACPTDSLSMTATFEVDPRHDGNRFLFTRNSAQLDVRFDAPDMERLHRLVNQPHEQLDAADRAWLDARIDPNGQHLIGIYGLGYFTPEAKKAADEAREAKKKAKDAAAAAAKAKAAAAAPPPAAGALPAVGAAPAAAAPAAKPAVPPPAADAASAAKPSAPAKPAAPPPAAQTPEAKPAVPPPAAPPAADAEKKPDPPPAGTAP